MKNITKKLVILLVMSLLITSTTIVNTNSTTVFAATKKVKLNKKKATIYVGKTVQLKLKNNKKKVKWSTSNKKVATVTKKGKVKGKKAGKATITAKVGKKKYKCKVTVKKQTLKKPTPQIPTQNTQQQTDNTAHIAFLYSEITRLNQEIAKNEGLKQTADQNYSAAFSAYSYAMSHKVQVYIEGVGFVYQVDQNAVAMAKGDMDYYKSKSDYYKAIIDADNILLTRYQKELQTYL